MTTAEADLIVLDHLLNQAAGIRMRAKTPLIGVRAGLLEEELTQRLRKLKETQAKQAPLFNAVDEDELPPAVGFSGQPKPDATK